MRPRVIQATSLPICQSLLDHEGLLVHLDRFLLLLLAISVHTLVREQTCLLLSIHLLGLHEIIICLHVGDLVIELLFLVLFLAPSRLRLALLTRNEWISLWLQDLVSRCRRWLLWVRSRVSATGRLEGNARASLTWTWLLQGDFARVQSSPLYNFKGTALDLYVPIHLWHNVSRLMECVGFLLGVFFLRPFAGLLFPRCSLFGLWSVLIQAMSIQFDVRRWGSLWKICRTCNQFDFHRTSIGGDLRRSLMVDLWFLSSLWWPLSYLKHTLLVIFFGLLGMLLSALRMI